VYFNINNLISNVGQPPIGDKTCQQKSAVDIKKEFLIGLLTEAVQ
jgi:hypothetical protein